MDTLVRESSQVITCTDFACRHAISHRSLCDCSTCFGEDHGGAFAAQREAFAAVQALRTDDPMRSASAASRRDDQADADMGAIPTKRREIPFCDRCMNCADDCDCEA